MATERHILIKPGPAPIEYFANGAYVADGSITAGGDDWGASAGQTVALDSTPRVVVCGAARKIIMK